MFDRHTLRKRFEAGIGYEDYVATGNPAQRDAWKSFHERVRLNEAQRALAGGFVRDMHVLVVSGVWCGDCVQQCPMLARIAEAAGERVRLRFIDRDEHADFTAGLRINAGGRVPVALFLAEDFEFVSMYGDRTLSRYRALAARQLGPSCPLPGAPVPDDEVAATLADWLGEFERVQLLLRLSGRLRQRHGD